MQHRGKRNVSVTVRDRIRAHLHPEISGILTVPKVELGKMQSSVRSNLVWFDGFLEALVAIFEIAILG